MNPVMNPRLLVYLAPHGVPDRHADLPPSAGPTPPAGHRSAGSRGRPRRPTMTTETASRIRGRVWGHARAWSRHHPTRGGGPVQCFAIRPRIRAWRWRPSGRTGGYPPAAL